MTTVDDATILAVYRSLPGKRTGSALRAELRRRFGSVCGVARIYRLIGEAAKETGQGSQSRAPPAPDLEKALAAAVDRADRAEHRERSHQVYWAKQVDELRVALRKAHEGTPASADYVARLERDLRSAWIRIDQLETALMAERERK